jgi:hypothetical protein
MGRRSALKEEEYSRAPVELAAAARDRALIPMLDGYPE